MKNNFSKFALLILLFTISSVVLADDTKAWINNFNSGEKTMEKALKIKKDLIKKEEFLLEAIAYFQKSIDVYPNSLVADKVHFLIAKCYMSLPFNKTANKKKALEQYEIIIEYIPLSKYTDKAKEMIEKIKSEEALKPSQRD